MSASDALALAQRHLEAGRWDAARELLTTIVQSDRRQHTAYAMLASLAFRSQQAAEAAELLVQAIRLAPDIPEYHVNLSVARNAQGLGADAEEAARQALRLRPGYAEVENCLGNALATQGRLSEAVAAFTRALKIRPEDPEIWNNLGNAEKALGQIEEAVAAYRRALALRPSLAGVWNNLGIALTTQGQLDDALAACRQAIAIQPDYAAAHTTMGNALLHQGRSADAARAYTRSLSIRPDANTEVNLSLALQAEGRLTVAIDACRRVLARQLGSAAAHNALGNALKAQGRIEAAIDAYRAALAARPDFVVAASNLVLALHYVPDLDPEDIAAAHVQWDRQHALSFRTSWRPFENRPDPDRPLRLGFVSPDFWRHPVSFHFLPFLESLDREEFQSVCYSCGIQRDAMTARLASAAGVWRQVAGWSDERLTEQIRQDGIDVLFDLAGHTANHRLLVFARKPAPIQIAWIGYVGTTGSSAIDYLIVDPFLVPPESDEQPEQAGERDSPMPQASHFCERLLRLPDGYVGFAPPAEAPAVGPLPALGRGHVTFGSFNNLAKLNPPLIAAWASILRNVPGSRLVLKYRGLEDEGTRQRFIDSFAQCGIDASRLELRGHSGLADMLANYHDIDLALDPFPFSGGATTCLALWMGVPVVTLPGRTMASRLSYSLLSTARCTETVAHSLDDYIERARSWASDLSRLANYRAELRERMANSPLCDGRRLAASVQQAIRNIWKEWCRQGTVG